MTCPDTKEGIIIDTPAEPEKLLTALGGVEIKAILITHGHRDHLLGFTKIRGKLGAPVGIGQGDAEELPRAPEMYLKDEELIGFGNQELKVLATPGHTDGSVCFLVGKHLFSGDTLFPGGPGKSSQPYGLTARNRQYHPKAIGLT